MSETIELEAKEEVQVVQYNESLFDKMIASTSSAQKDLDAIQINGLDDKENYKAVDTIRKAIRKDRLDNNKVTKQIVDDIYTFYKSAKDKAGEVNDAYLEVEEAAKAKLKVIDDEKERLKKEEEEKFERMIDERMSLIGQLGLQHDGTHFYIDKHRFNREDISKMSDDEYEGFLALIESAIEDKRAQEEEAKAKADAQAKKLAEEKAAREKAEKENAVLRERLAALEAEKVVIVVEEAVQEETPFPDSLDEIQPKGNEQVLRREEPSDIIKWRDTLEKEKPSPQSARAYSIGDLVMGADSVEIEITTRTATLTQTGEVVHLIYVSAEDMLKDALRELGFTVKH